MPAVCFYTDISGTASGERFIIFQEIVFINFWAFGSVSIGYIYTKKTALYLICS